MLCARPIALESGARVGCGQCLNCDINKRRQWTARILLEGIACEKALGEVSWLTLTYADESLPSLSRGSGNPVPTLRPGDYQLAFKRMRKDLGPFRFGLVGEYGDQNGRPHYHALLFGPRVSAVERSARDQWARVHGHILNKPWGLHDNANQAGDARIHRAQYIAHYVTKKMHSLGAPKLRAEQEPEFWRSSRRPGIGCTPSVLNLVTSKAGSMVIAETGDVPRTIRVAGRLWPIHPNVRAWLRDELGIPQRQEERLEALPEAVQREEPTPAAYEQAARQCAKLERRYKHAGRRL